MALTYLSPINLGKLELQNARIHNLATAPTNPVAGQIYYDTAAFTMYFYRVAYDAQNNIIGQGWVDIKGDIQEVVAGAGMTGGGTGGAVQLDVAAGTGITVNPNSVQLDLANTRNVDHTGLDVLAGSGLTGGGELTGDVTLNIGVTASSGIELLDDAIQFRNYASLTQYNIMMWGAGGQLENAPIIRTVDLDNNPTITIQGNLIVTGTTTSINSNEVNIGDSIIRLNSDELGAPSQNGGFEVERGTETNVSFVWDETADRFTTGGSKLHVGDVESIVGLDNQDYFFMYHNAVGEVGELKKSGFIDVAELMGAPKWWTLDPIQDTVSKSGNTYTITHTFNTKAIAVQILDSATYETVYVDVARPTNATVTVAFASAVTNGAYIAILSASKINGDNTLPEAPQQVGEP
jgi:hypothetical protein